MKRALLVLLLSAGCDVDFERMLDQPSYRPFEPSSYFEDGKVMQKPPPGTVPRSREIGPPELIDGGTGDRYAERIPIPVDRPLLERGRNRFEVFCGACHGRRGDGVSQVSENMSLARAPSLLAPPISEYPPGRYYRIVARGFGLMPSYADELTVRDRWAVVAYIGALQLSQSARLGELPQEMQREAEPWLK